MEVTFNSKIKNTYYSLKKIYQQNELSNYILNDYLLNNFDAIDSELIKQIQSENKNYSTYDAFCYAFYSIMGIEDDDIEISSLNENNKLSNFKELNTNDYESNDFYLFLKTNFKEKNIDSKYSLKENYYAPYEGFLYDDIEIDGLYEINKVGYFKNKFVYYNLIENNNVWMNITPFEINTMKKPIEKAYGNVLTFGLGLGYFAYMVSKKEEVKSLTIVEKDEKIIDFISKNIIDKFENKSKIKIIKDDIYKYPSSKLKDFDYIFIDTYRQGDDGLNFYFDLYSKFKNTNFNFWIENSILSTFKKYIFLFLASIFDKKYYKEFQLNSFQKRIIDFLNSKYQDKKINNKEDLMSLFEYKNITELF